MFGGLSARWGGGPWSRCLLWAILHLNAKTKSVDNDGRQCFRSLCGTCTNVALVERTGLTTLTEDGTGDSPQLFCAATRRYGKLSANLSRNKAQLNVRAGGCWLATVQRKERRNTQTVTEGWEPYFTHSRYDHLWIPQRNCTQPDLQRCGVISWNCNIFAACLLFLVDLLTSVHTCKWKPPR